MVLVREAQAEDQRAWDAYVAKSQDATVFHLFCWRHIVQKVHGHKPAFLIATENNQVVGLMPLFEVRSMLFGKHLTSLPFCPYGGAIGDSEDIVKALEARALECCKQLGLAYLEIRKLQPSVSAHPVQDIYVTFRKAISSNAEENMNAIPRKQRAMVRKGIKNGLTANLATAEEFFELYLDNIHRHGTPGSPISFFKEITAAMPGNAEFLLVKDSNGVAVSGVFTLYFKNEVLPFYAGDIERSRELAANDFKYWAVMERARERGCTVFDFGRSKKGTGPYSFKKNWGFEPTQLHYEFQGLNGKDVPNNNPLNPKYRLMIEVWRRLPRSFVKWLGPKVVPGLG